MDYDFSPELVLSKPLMAHLASASSQGARHSPLWFLWEASSMWLVAGDNSYLPLRNHGLLTAGASTAKLRV